jgi:aldehyde:ferredoxin oxidoreductase
MELFSSPVPIGFEGDSLIVAYKRQHSKLSDKLVRWTRSGQKTANLVESGSLARYMLKNKNKKHCYVLYADQTPLPGSKFVVNFLHRETTMINGPEVLSRLIDCPVVYFEMMRERRGRYKIVLTKITDKPSDVPEGYITEKYDILPVMNFKYGDHKDCPKIDMEVWKKYFTQGVPDGCWIGCNMSCAKGVDNFELRTGPYKGSKVIVDGPEYENAAALGSNIAIFDPLAIIEQNFYCDTYGVCTITWGNIVGFLMECWDNGILNAERTGGVDLTWGNADASLELLHQMARGEGFGVTAGLGVMRLKKMFVDNKWGDPQFIYDIAMENKGLEYSMYLSKESLAQQGGYAMTNKGPQHDEAWLIFMDMVNNMIPTFENKAEALHYFPYFRTWFGLAGFCKLCWNDIEPADNAQQPEPNKVPEHVDNYVTIFKAVTGREFDKEEMIRMSERVYNFQKIFNIRLGFGTREYDAQPYRAAGPVTQEEYLSRQERYDKQLSEILGINPEELTLEQKMSRLREHREDQYEKLLDAVYFRRGWNKNGVPKIEHLQKIGMDLPELIEVVKPLQ